MLLDLIYQWIQENKDVYKKDPTIGWWVQENKDVDKKDPDPLIVRLMLVHRKYIRFIYSILDYPRKKSNTADAVSGNLFKEFIIVFRKKIRDGRSSTTPELMNRIITMCEVLGERISQHNVLGERQAIYDRQETFVRTFTEGVEKTIRNVECYQCQELEHYWKFNWGW
jgi:hypothetical protein